MVKRRRPYRRASARVLGAVSFCAASVLALPAITQADATWTGGAGDGLWPSANNWNPAAAPGATSGTTNTDTAFFDVAAPGTVTVDSGRNLANINFTLGAGAFTLTGGSLLLSAGGITQTATGAGANNESVNSPITLEGNYTFTSGYTTNTLLLGFGGPIGSASGGPTTLTLNGANTGANTITGVIADGSAGSTVAVAKSAAGTWVLAGANTYSGGTTLSAGVLRLGSASAGSVGSITSSAIGQGPLVLNSGTLSSGNTTARTILNPVTIGGSVTLGDGTNTGALTFSAGATLTATPTLTINSSVIYNGAITGAFGLTKAGNGALTLGTANSYSGTTTINAGQFIISADSALGTGSTVTIGGGGELVLNAAGTYGSTRTINITGTGVNSLGALSSGSSSTSTIWAGTVNVAVDAARIGTTGTSGFLDVQGVIQGTNAAPAIRTNDTAGVIQFSNANTYTGSNTQIVVGGLKLNHTGALPSTTAVTFGNSSGASANNLNLNGFSTAILGIATVSGNTTPSTITSAGAATLTVGNSTPTAYAYGDTVASTTYGTITGALALSKTGTNTQTLAGLANTYSGGTSITGGGTLAVSSTATLGTGGVTITPTATLNSTLDLSAATPASAGVIADNASLTLSNLGTDYGRVAFGSSTLNEVVGSLVVNGVSQPSGTYTSSNLTNFITGTGSITVAPEPASIGLAALAAIGLLARRKRRERL